MADHGTRGRPWNGAEYRAAMVYTFPPPLHGLLEACRNHTLAWALEQLPLIGNPVWGHGVPEDADLVRLAWALGQLAWIHGDPNHHDREGRVVWTATEQAWAEDPWFP